MNRCSLEGLRVGLLIRNSTPRQQGNFRSLDQEDRLVSRITAEGGEPVLYDEQGTSGRDLAKRDVARAMLADLDAGTIHAIGAWDIKRLTRDEFGGDAGVIAKRLVKRRALLVTVDRDYRLWDDEDLFDYRLKATLSGQEIGAIRRGFWDGVFARAAREPMFMGTAPVGYSTRLVEDGSGYRTRVRRDPMKHAAHAALMASLREWLDSRETLGEVVLLVNTTYRELLGQVGHTAAREREGRPVHWGIQHLRYLLDNPVYWGVFEFGRTVDRTNGVWDRDHRRARRREFWHVADGSGQCPCGRDHRRLGDLRYWTAGDAARWRRKFAFPHDQPAKRTRTYDHHLRGVFACATCGQAMVAFGPNGYQCPWGKQRGCQKPQGISEARGFAALETILPGVLARLGPAVRAAAAAVEGTEAVARQARDAERVLLSEQLEAMTDEWYGPQAAGNGGRVPAPVLRRMREAQARLDVLEAEAGALDAAQVSTAEALALAEVLEAGDLATFGELPRARQGALYRELLAGVRVVGEGSGSGRRHQVLAGWREPLRERLGSAETASGVIAYLGTAGLVAGAAA